MDIQLHYIQMGGGFPLILLHGNGEDNGVFVNQKDEFAQHYRVIAIDTRGHGASPRGNTEFTLERFAEDLFEFMQSIGVEKAHLLGFSDGANIALLFALKHPEMVERLVLNGGNLRPAGIKWFIQLPITLACGLVGLISLFDRKAKPKFEMLNLMTTQPHIKRKRLAALSMPVLVMAGSNDMVREGHTRLISRSIPHSQLAILEGTHFIAADCPKAYNRTVLNFLSEKEQSQT